MSDIEGKAVQGNSEGVWETSEFQSRKQKRNPASCSLLACSTAAACQSVPFSLEFSCAMSSDRINVILKRFERPDEVRVLQKGRFELVHIGGMTIGRAAYEPGWKWSEHVRPITGTELCEVEHVGLALIGRCAVRMRDGKEIVLKPGDLFYVKPGHDSWVVGDEPYVSIHFLGAGQYAK